MGRGRPAAWARLGVLHLPSNTWGSSLCPVPPPLSRLLLPPPISLIPLASYVQDIMGTVPSTLRMNRFPGGLSLYLRG